MKESKLLQIEYALDYLDRLKHIEVQKKNEMKDVYCCWVGFVAMFSCGVAKKNKEKKTHMSYGLVMNSCKSSLLQIAFHLV